MASALDQHYRVLGVDRAATAAEIKKAYRRLARRFHPDLNPGDARAESQFKRISEAYEVLSDPARREFYDRFGDAPGAGFTPRPASEDRAAGGASLRDVLNELFRGSSTASALEPDLHSTVDVSFEDAIRGATVRVLVRRTVVCDACRGGSRRGSRVRCDSCGGAGFRKTGGFFRSETRPCAACNGLGARERGGCAACGGNGQRLLEETLTVRIPPGVDSGSRVRVSGRGNQLPGSDAPGDLFVVTRVGRHRHLTREGDNLLLRVPLTLAEAALGGKVEVPTVDGPASIRIPPGTQSGQRFRLRGRGVPSLRHGARGDQLVEVTVIVPKLEDERSREIVRELDQLHPEDPRAGLFD